VLFVGGVLAQLNRVVGPLGGGGGGRAEREDCIKSLRIFDLRCNHFINFHICYFLLRERDMTVHPLVNALNLFCEKIR
jgi:hypothetical protein